MRTILPFQDLNKEAIPVAGGKGANLGEMTQAGMPVPPGFVVTTAAYDAFVQANGLRQRILDLAGTLSTSDPSAGEAISEQIRALFSQGEIEKTLAAEIAQAYAHLAKNGAAVAVRSSATAEDLPTASFAGQQDTFLNVQSEADLLDAVKACWASLWTARAMVYRQRQGIEPARVSLAVVVQRLVPAQKSGILFTANPVNGERGEMLINATWGLGEAIVSGQVTPDTVVVEAGAEDSGSFTVLSRETATKTVMTVRTEAGTEEQPVPPAQQIAPVLDDETALALARYGAQIQRHYGMPMDIEWAIASATTTAGDDGIAILQARPITSLPDPKPAKPDVTWEPPVPDTMWMRRQIVEHMPEPLSPLFEDLYLEQGLDETMDNLMGTMAEMGETDVDLEAMIPHGFARTINGYAYTTGSVKMTASDVMTILRIYAHFSRFLTLTAFDWDGTVFPTYQATIARWDALDLAQTADETLLDGIQELAIADSGYWFGSAVNLGLSRALDPFFNWLLKTPLFHSALPDPKLGSSSFLRGFDSKALDAQAHMESIAKTIRGDDELLALTKRTPAEGLLDALADHPKGGPIVAEIRAYLEEYGHQIYNLDFVVPTQIEEPLPVLLSLRALVNNPPKQDVRSRQAQMATERDALIAQTVQNLNPVSRPIFELVWKWTKKYAPYRETVMFYMGWAWPTARKLAGELGRRLVEAGAITRADDIYYVRSDEIKQVIAARHAGEAAPDLAPLAQERRTLREARKLLTPLPKVPKQSSLQYGPLNLSIFDPTPSDAVNTGSVLNGYAVSTGKVTAPASVIRSIEDFDKMQPGSVLVCTTTTPAWTPLFSQAVGLVTDVGGALAHGSIVAREYGIPAVMGTGVATERIHSGMMLTVDGDAGTVVLVEEGEDEGTTEEPPKETKSGWGRKLALILGVVALVLWWRRRKK